MKDAPAGPSLFFAATCMGGVVARVEDSKIVYLRILHHNQVAIGPQQQDRIESYKKRRKDSSHYAFPYNRDARADRSN